MPYGHERLGAVGGRIPHIAIPTPRSLSGLHGSSYSRPSAARGGRKSNQRRLTVEIALRIPTRTRRVDLRVAAPAGARDFDLCVTESSFFVRGWWCWVPCGATASSAAQRRSRKSNQRRLTGEIALRTLGGTRRVDVCVAASAGVRDFDLFVGEILFMHLSFIHATVARIIANIILLFCTRSVFMF